MKTLVFESEAAKAIIGTEETVSIVVRLNVNLERYLKYETPFGKTYSWASGAEIESVTAEWIDYADGAAMTKFMILSPKSDLSKEVSIEINKYLRSIGT